MDSLKDTFGLALMAYFDDPTSAHEIERDDGYINITETKNYFREYDAWHPVEQELAKLVKGKVLDIGCGNGRCLKYFLENGVEAIGIDLSEHAIEAAKRFGVNNCMVMNALNLEFSKNSFDTAALFGNGLGLCGLKDSRKMLEGLHRVVNQMDCLSLPLETQKSPPTPSTSPIIKRTKNREIQSD